MDVITLRIPEELKEEMKKRPDINWSEVMREAIAKKIAIEERLEAVRRVDEAKRRIKSVEKGQLDRWIREDRLR